MAFDAIAALFAGGGAEAAAGAAIAGGAAATVLPTMAITATSLASGAATALTLGEVAGAAGLAAAGYSALTASDLNDLGYEFDMPLNDADVSKMTQEAGTSIGLQDKGFSWVDGLGWAKTGLGLLGAGANAYGQYRQGQNAANNANAAANDSRLSAEDAKRRADQLEQWGMGQSKVMQPWDENGGRALAGEQLKALLSDPAGVAANDPAYKLRMQAASRAMGIYGQDSGAMGVAAADASSTWYDQRLAQLGGLAGANAAPGAGGQLGYQTLTGSANIAGMGQASGAFANQAAGAANNAKNAANVQLFNAAGQLVNAAGQLIGGGTGSGSRIGIGVTGDGSGGGGGGGALGDTFVDNSNLQFGSLPGTGISQGGTVVGGNTPPPPDGLSGPTNTDEIWQPPQPSTQGPLQIQGPGNGPILPGAGAFAGGPAMGPLQQMQGLGQPPVAKMTPEARTHWRFQDPEVSAMSNLGQPGQPQFPGNPQFPPGSGPMPNAQGNAIGPAGTIDPTLNTIPLGPGDQTGNMSYQYDSPFPPGDLLGNYLNPKARRQGMGG